eukprot:TRINITY_DN102247_c0_g1_i1.p1 TRINITY_DN102247_c0_g1~~TRINITY_DN102247_c0_g1_i1.p1  ORF type:complete len:291 (-),score=71.00 TRINITY_DN102247_c0_g1_i1:163-1035(-)
MSLTLLPYGNAHLSAGGSAQCQHGQDECNYNLIQACAIEHFQKKPENYLPFVMCTERILGANSAAAVSQVVAVCAGDSATSFSITDCYGDGRGTQALKIVGQVAAETATMNHQYIPWITVNGKHSQAAEGDLVKAVCDSYSASPKPAACAAMAVAVEEVVAGNFTGVTPGICMKGLGADEDEAFRRHLEETIARRASREALGERGPKPSLEEILREFQASSANISASSASSASSSEAATASGPSVEKNPTQADGKANVSVDATAVASLAADARPGMVSPHSALVRRVGAQ